VPTRASRESKPNLAGAVRFIDTVLFDLDDTLHDDTAAYQAAARMVAVEIARTHGIDPDVLLRAYIAEAQSFWKKLSVEHLSMGITDTRAQLWANALQVVGIDDSALAERCAADYTRNRADVLELAPGALDCVRALRARGCKLGIVTNGFAATHHEKIARLGLTPHFDALFIADEMGMVKPDPAVFAHACAVLGTVPERTAMVGDRFDRDIVGAQSVGMFTVLIDVHAIPIPDGAVPPDAVVPSIADVLGELTGYLAQGPSAQVQKGSA
jgi:putative hydrolase of the HAD superfamily